MYVCMYVQCICSDAATLLEVENSAEIFGILLKPSTDDRFTSAHCQLTKSVVCHKKSADFCCPTQSADKIGQTGRVLFSPTKIG